MSLPGPPGEDANVPRLSFSAALTRPQDNAGTIVFNKVFVNERKAYNPKTGMYVKDNHIVCELRTVIIINALPNVF